jgi:hypothetical protein
VTLSAIEYACWLLGAILSLAAGIQSLKHGHADRLPWFTAFLLFAPVKSVVLAFVFHLADPFCYGISYYIFNALNSVLMLGCVGELTRDLLWPKWTLPDWVAPQFRVSLYFALFFVEGSILLSGSFEPMKVFYTVNKMATSAVLVSLIVMIGRTVDLGIPWDRLNRGATIGMCIVLFPAGIGWMMNVSRLVPMGTFTAAALVWCVTFRPMALPPPLTAEDVAAIKKTAQFLREYVDCVSS